MDDSALKVAVAAAPVRQMVVHKLREAIVFGRFRLGEPLRERMLCELTGVSRTAVREALRQLESEGLVVNRPNRGPVVAPISREDAQSLYEVREQIETLVYRLYVERATDSDLRALSTIVERLDESTDDPETFLRTKLDYYAHLLEVARNASASWVLSTLMMRATQLRSIGFCGPNRPRESVKQIRAIVSALKCRDQAAAQSAAVTHVRAASRTVLRALDRNPDNPPTGSDTHE